MSLHFVDGNNRFRAYFEKQGINALQTLYHQSVSHTPDHKVIWVWDGEAGAEARRTLYPGYKGGRNNEPVDTFFQTQNFFKQVLKHSNCLQIEVPAFEADDVIAALARGSSQIITIDSSDADFLALCNERISVTRDPLPDVEPEFVRLYKTLVGDKSDKINGLKGFGDVGWKKLQYSERQLIRTHFEGKTLTGADVQELCGITASQAKNWDAQQEELKIYWNITGFYEVPEQLISQHLTSGVYNALAVQQLLASQMFSMAPAVGQ